MIFLIRLESCLSGWAVFFLSRAPSVSLAQTLLLDLPAVQFDFSLILKVCSFRFKLLPYTASSFILSRIFLKGWNRYRFALLPLLGRKIGVLREVGVDLLRGRTPFCAMRNSENAMWKRTSTWILRRWNDVRRDRVGGILRNTFQNRPLFGNRFDFWVS